MIANLAVEAIGTRAVELVLSLVEEVRYASAIVLASVALASGKRYRAIFATVKRIAMTVVVGLTVGAVSVLAGIVELALIDVFLAVVTLKTGIALAGVVAEVVYTCSFIARVTLALVYVYFAVLAHRTLRTQTLVPVINGH